MKKINWTGKIYLSLLVFLLITFNSCQKKDTQEKADKDLEMISGHWQFKGHIGEYIDRISEQRILDEKKWDTIYPETEEAFLLREDDKNYPTRGEWRGEFWGKYLLSVIAAAKYYHSDDLKERIAEAVKGLSKYQDENGYIGTYSHSDFLEGNNWNVWSRKYTLWGLVEAWQLLEDDSILNIAGKFTDQLISEVGPGAEDIVKTGNFYGMPSSSILYPVVKLYNATGEKKYLDYAEYIVLQWSEHPEKLPDILNKGLGGEPVHVWFAETAPYKWAKGYEFTSCVEGLVELYKVTEKQQYLDAAKNIHSALVAWERTPVGSVSFNDKYVGSAGLINTVSEVCDAVYWNRLSFELYTLTADTRYLEEIERTLYNSLLCAFNQEGDWGLRRLRMSHVHIPAMNHFLEHHQCCTDNLPRGLFQAAEATLISKGSDIYLGLFNDGEGDINLPSGNKVTVKLDGDFLSTSSVRATISIDKPEKFDFYIRMPQWSSNTIVEVNGAKRTGEEKNNWLSIHREWENGDVIKIEFKLPVRYETFDMSKANTLFYPVDFYNKEWANIAFKKGSSEEMNQRYEHIKSLPEKEALPQQPAVTFFYGPLALSRDVRITEGDIFAPVSIPENAQTIKINPVKTSPGMWKAFELNLGDGQIINFCDFSSAGNTWSDQSKFNTWCILKNE
ncbi:hypothetical protein GM418_31010 [Maribellus comscasis]|uniref:Glycoside hydrolase family 127 protein n=1 Tax=Maribellus comscasis TaxID=2681766 RepID=A0A6I6K392_9BACT|nr:beta-L-arabinofuranosidase domain-containing protein [Maribellus comscasis]QGY47928.1 hypothetical protein GM418_31010 [Maribellus comscasis]